MDVWKQFVVDIETMNLEEDRTPEDITKDRNHVLLYRFTKKLIDYKSRKSNSIH